ncbi:hypothetical protein BDN72DRAFT_495098 [Pluteus cervinus]|uniref:Uncharacterized protein n=1 Tax=Pluteus cervinus TaxID=181527 RepID=A0ACD3AZY0_9AGAR|nr:hypothetical protein BDN72DRAFT_495098 [Pluteus cervinus]
MYPSISSSNDTAIGYFFGKLNINGKTSPPVLLPALHGALFPIDLHDVSIVFAPSLARFSTHVQILTDLIERSSSNTNLDLDLLSTGLMLADYHGNRDSESLIEQRQWATPLQELMNVALKKGCTNLRIRSGYLRAPRCYNPRPASPAAKTHLRSSFTRKLDFSRRKAPGLKDTGRVLESRSLIAPPPSHPVVFCPNTGRSASCSLSDLFFQSTFRDWTLNFLNHGGFTDVHIDTSVSIYGSMWDDFLPQVSIPNLKQFSFDVCWVDLFRLAWFIQRHSTTLTALTLDFYSSFVSTLDRCPLHMDFLALRSLALPSLYIPWFLDVVMSDPTSSHPLPNLSSLKILIRRSYSEYPTLG